MRDASEVAQLDIQGSVDFMRARVKEDIGNLIRRRQGKEPIRTPVVARVSYPAIDFRNANRGDLRFLAWNLDAASQSAINSSWIINADGRDRRVREQNISRQGQYLLVFDFSSSGVALRYGDRKIVLRGFGTPHLEVPILNTNPPPDTFGDERESSE